MAQVELNELHLGQIEQQPTNEPILCSGEHYGHSCCPKNPNLDNLGIFRFWSILRAPRAKGRHTASTSPTLPPKPLLVVFGGILRVGESRLGEIPEKPIFW